MEVPHGASSRFVASRRVLWSLRSRFFRVCASPDPCFVLLCLPAAGVGGSGPGEVRRSRPVGRRAQLVLGAVTSLVLTCIQMSDFKNKLGLNWSARKSNKVVFFFSPLIPRFILS
jgi:hypothetical protein